MKIILSPAKKMIVDNDNIAPVELPAFIDKTAEILSWMKSKSKEELKAIWKCNDKIAEQNFNILKPMDGVTPYRLEMQAKAEIGGTKNLYDYWGDRLYHSVTDDSRIIINLASKEYSKCIERYLSDKDNYITITFCELSGDKLVTKGTYAKMARGEMVRFMAENNIENPVDIQKFDRLGYTFRGNLSSETEYVFERKVEK